MVNHMENFKNQVKEEFQEYYDVFWGDYDGDWDNFKDEAIETLWNRGKYETIVRDYEAIFVMLDIIKENYEGFGMDFKDYNDPQKIFNSGMYFIAKEVLNEATEQDFDREDCFVINDHITIEPLQA